jgi:uncharacterized protein (TIGR02217 family)
MTAIHDAQFPSAWTARAQVQIEHPVRIQTRTSGIEERTTLRAAPLRVFQFAACRVREGEAVDLSSFYAARLGALHAFRLRDRLDWKSCAYDLAPAATDQLLGHGDGVTQRFALFKRSPGALAGPVRRISRPIADSVLIAVNGAAAAASAFSVEYAGGWITFVSPPTNGAVITAGFLFDTLVRFDTEPLTVACGPGASASIGAFKLIEVLEP